MNSPMQAIMDLFALHIERAVIMSIISNKRLIVVLVILILIAVGLFLLLNKDEPKQSANNHAEKGEEKQSEKKEEASDPREPSIQTDIPSLAEAYESYFPIGAAIEPQHTEGLTAELLKKHVNMIVAENAMKPASLQPMEGNFQWEKADRIVEFAKANGMELRFHTLVWHNQS